MFEKIIIPETPELIKNEVDFSQMFSDASIDPSLEIKQQPIAISIRSSEYKGVMYPIPFGSYGDFSCIVGASKAKKTFFKSMIEAGYLGGKSNLLIPSIKGHNQKDKYVISCDTEQSEFHVQRVQRRVLDMIGSSSDFYKTFSLRKYPPKERFEFIDWLMAMVCRVCGHLIFLRVLFMLSMTCFHQQQTSVILWLM